MWSVVGFRKCTCLEGSVIILKSGNCYFHCKKDVKLNHQAHASNIEYLFLKDTWTIASLLIIKHCAVDLAFVDI